MTLTPVVGDVTEDAWKKIAKMQTHALIAKMQKMLCNIE